jgi:protein-tyrosine phosphatase
MTKLQVPLRYRLRWHSLVRWVSLAWLRVLYRQWTRIAACLFPEESAQARLAERLHVPLPDRLDLSWVTPMLAVGGRIHPEDILHLASAGIRQVIDVRAEYQDDETALNRAGISLLYLPAPDTYPLTIEQLLTGSEWADNAIKRGERVLVHCEHGVGRSVLLACAILIRQGFSAEQAVRLVQKKRWQAAPNHRQIKRLQEFVAALHGQSSLTNQPPINEKEEKR